eukprot:gnl/Chilomastix_cuspidata/1490.p1 GENE.gnl/Chilomastix_cuspidata/1490~~gnl/Chilomastix_cuspidata/1490.p1  ORF type:complete len:437 (-),score=155.20 gnl/Chilomastix_cuspidata/1490:535-1845(-)
MRTVPGRGVSRVEQVPVHRASLQNILARIRSQEHLRRARARPRAACTHRYTFSRLQIDANASAPVRITHATHSDAAQRPQAMEQEKAKLIGNFHGGQSWRHAPNYIEDMSVTTNGIGPPDSAKRAALEAMEHIGHYPDQRNADTLRAVAAFLGVSMDTLVLGNGASELIDLVIRSCEGPFREGPFRAQYSEYRRVAANCGFDVVPWGAGGAGVTTIIRPNSPTGDFMPLAEVREHLRADAGVFVFDESFLPFLGRTWLQESALRLVDEFPERVFVIHSWTKIFGCPGIRIGSVCASAAAARRVERIQVPWSVSVPAQAFLAAAAADTRYLERTWEFIAANKAKIEAALAALNAALAATGKDTQLLANADSPAWVPWLFIRTPSEAVAKAAHDAAFECGVPIRWCVDHGLPECVRLGIRDERAHGPLFAALRAALAE